MKKVSSMLSAFVLVMTGCGANIEHQEVTKAPQNTAELGWIATEISAEQHQKIMQAHPAGLFRNHGKGFAYEYRGLSKEEILEIAPNAKVEKNFFIPPQTAYSQKKAPTRESLLQFLEVNLDNEFSPENCISNPFLISPQIKMSNFTAGTFPNTDPEVGQNLGFKNNKAADDDALTAWMILPPNGSKLSSDLFSNEAISFKPDMAGGYTVVLFYKKNGQCNFSRSDFFVINNSPYDPEFSESELDQLRKLSEDHFYQISSANADKAQNLLSQVDHEIVKIAVLDSGVNYNNPSLKNRMWTNKGEIQGDGVDNDQNGLIDDYVGYDFADDDGQPMDDFGHGSHVAGLVAGEYTGSSSDNVQIIAIKVGGARGPDLGSVVSGILYAVEQGASVINLSFGSNGATESVRAALELASDAGVLAVVASGNGNQFGIGVDNDTTPHYPSSYDLPNILAVGAVRTDDALTRYSNYGIESVDVATVGGFSDVSSGPSGLLSSAYIPNPSEIVTQPLAGTSMASPFAAGIAGLILSVAPQLTPPEVIEIMINTSRKTSVLEGKIKSEAVLDAEAAVLSALSSRLD